MKLFLITLFFIPFGLIAQKEQPVIKTAQGFKAELVYSVNNKKEGSWVSICFDDKGRIYACDQFGDLYRVTLQEEKVAEVKKIKSPGRAQGLLWAFDSLYFMANGTKSNNGLNRLSDSNGDGELDKIENIVPLKGAGGHGPHSIIKTHDGKGLMFVCGNYVSLPDKIVYPPKRDYREDTLLPHLKDSNGHAASLKAPGGYVMRINPDGTGREVVATGFRNTYDIALSPTGELFGYDADMEWDSGTPWYRPTRVTHITRNAEFGWRTGTSKWPAYYADSLDGILNVGPGSPTAVFFGTKTKFPQKYRDSLFIVDWTFGRIYSISLKSKGASYSATKEVLIAGKPLPIVAATVGPDGAIYFVTGGRRIQSGLYKVSYVGKEATDKISKVELNSAQKLRKKLESMHKSSPGVTTFAWPHLKSEDRFIRYAARVAIEFQPSSEWQSKFYQETDSQALITGALAMARKADSKEKTATLKKLLTINWQDLKLSQKLELLRSYSLCFIRMGAPDKELKNQLLQFLEPLYPEANNMLNRELCRLLVYLESNQAIAKTTLLMKTSRAVKQDIDEEMLKDNAQYGKSLQAMLKNSPDTQALHYALMLRNVKKGWTDSQAVDYFSWLSQAESKSGGRSFQGFIKNIRKDALQHQNEETKKKVAELSKQKQNIEPLPTPKGPGRSWTQEEAVKAVADLSGANAENGMKMYKAALCYSCHAFKGQGGSAGPDLTQLGSRFNKADILDAILRPSAAVAEQYQNYIVSKNDGSSVTGKIMNDTKSFVEVASNPFDFSNTIRIEKSEIKSIKASKHSAMPPALINSLNPQELRDLMSFLIGK